jgi:DNA-binding protein H-NS
VLVLVCVIRSRKSYCGFDFDCATIPATSTTNMSGWIIPYLSESARGIVPSLITAGASAVATLEQIQARLKKLQEQADAIVAKQSSAVLEKIRGLMAKHGLTTADIDAHVGITKHSPRAGAKAVLKTAQSVAKYRDLKSGASWSGRGRAPQWIGNVKDRSRFLVGGNDRGVAPTPETKAKAAGNYVRGPQPAKYRDPKSGATWSGRGRAPEWLASAKERSRFLIDGASAATDSSAANRPKVVAKKAAAQRAPAKKMIGDKKVGAATNVASAPEVPVA